MAHIHDVVDRDEEFLIDPKTRLITNQSGKTTLMQFDHNSERFTFALPLKIDDHDMSQCNKVEVHFINIGNDGNSNPGLDTIKDIRVDPNDDETAICSWLIQNDATQLAGTLSFVISFKCIDENGDLEYAWHTFPYSEIRISAGMDNGKIITQTYPDVLNEWYKALLEAGGEGISVVEKHVEEVTKPTVDAYAKNVIDERVAIERSTVGSVNNTKLSTFEKDYSLASVVVDVNYSDYDDVDKDKTAILFREVGKNILPYPYYDKKRTMSEITGNTSDTFGIADSNAPTIGLGDGVLNCSGFLRSIMQTKFVLYKGVPLVRDGDICFSMTSDKTSTRKDRKYQLEWTFFEDLAGTKPIVSFHTIGDFTNLKIVKDVSQYTNCELWECSVLVTPIYDDLDDLEDGERVMMLYDPIRPQLEIGSVPTTYELPKQGVVKPLYTVLNDETGNGTYVSSAKFDMIEMDDPENNTLQVLLYNETGARSTTFNCAYVADAPSIIEAAAAKNLADAKAYVDSEIAEVNSKFDVIDSDIEQRYADIIQEAEDKDAVTLNAAKAYTNEKIAEINEVSPELIETINQLKEAIEDDDSAIGSITNTITTKHNEAMAEIAAAENRLTTYVDTETTTKANAAKDAAIETAVADANTYTDEQIASIVGETNDDGETNEGEMGGSTPKMGVIDRKVEAAMVKMEATIEENNNLVLESANAYSKSTISPVEYSIKNLVFDGGSVGLQYEPSGGGYVCSGIGECVDKEPLVISSSVMGKVAASIANEAFKGNTNIRQLYVDVPERERTYNTTINKSAFENCDSLQKVTIYNQSIIGELAFANNNALKEVSIGKTTYIDRRAFYNNPELTRVTLPNEVNSIGDEAFAMCPKLTSLEIPGVITMPGVDMFDLHTIVNARTGATYGFITKTNILYLMTKRINSKKARCEIYHIPKNNTSFKKADLLGTLSSDGDAAGGWYIDTLPEACFANIQQLTKAIIPSTVTSIPARCFDGCKKLESISMPKTMVSIGSDAFKDTKVNLTEDGVDYIVNSDYPLDSLKTYIATNVKGSSTHGDVITIKDGTTVMADGAFDNILGRDLILELPSSLLRIGTPNSIDQEWCNWSDVAKQVIKIVRFKGSHQDLCNRLTGGNVPEDIPMYEYNWQALWTQRGFPGTLIIEG